MVIASATLLFATDVFFPAQGSPQLWGVRFAALVLGLLGIRLCVAGVVWYSMKDMGAGKGLFMVEVTKDQADEMAMCFVKNVPH